jgi:hypothetical protein
VSRPVRTGTARRAAGIKDLRNDLATHLRAEIAGMGHDNFLVRPHRRYVEKYSSGKGWAKVDADARHELIEHVAGLPSAVVDDDLAAKQFDLVVFRAELALLRVRRPTGSASGVAVGPAFQEETSRWVEYRRSNRTFQTTTADLLRLSEWLAANECTHVAMEATGVYWNGASWTMGSSRWC